MNRASVFADLTQIFHQVFDDDSLILHDALSAKDIAQWDSLNQINIVVAVEQKYGIKFKTGEVALWSNVGQFVDTILQKLEKQHA